MVAHIRIDMVNFKVGLAIALFESERAQLAFSIVQLTQQDADSCGNNLVAFRYGWRNP